jgi:hypothetical protein
MPRTTGDLLAEKQVQADRKKKLLDALGRAVTTLREKLGESLSSVRCCSRCLSGSVHIAPGARTAQVLLLPRTTLSRAIFEAQISSGRTRFEQDRILAPSFSLFRSVSLR